MANVVNKVLTIAEGEVGYLEKRSNAQLDSKTENAGKANFTKYWKELSPNLQGQPWCNAFVDWIFIKAYGAAEAKKLLCTSGAWSFYTPTSAQYFKNKGQWYINNPKPGDIIYFKNTQRICHVGIVYQVDKHYVYTIEGNTSAGAGVIPNGGEVAKKKYMLNNSRIAGYGRPIYDEGTTAKTSEAKPQAASNQAFAPYKVEIITPALNIRKAPGLSNPITRTAREGEKYTIIEEKDGWGLVKSKIGWMSLNPKYSKRV